MTRRPPRYRTRRHRRTWVDRLRENPLWSVLGLIVLIALIGVGSVWLSSRAGAPEPTTAAALPFPNVERISIDDTLALLESGDAVLIDARSVAAYAASHATGAISMPYQEVVDRVDELPEGVKWIFYCT